MTQAASPFHDALRASVAALYSHAPDRVPKTLMVCRCPVCMTEATLASILATPVRTLEPDLIREYSNSAHGTPTDPDDLNALLPRYLDLIAQDIEVQWNPDEAALKRFGAARGRLSGFPAPAMGAELDRYARLLLLHFGTLQAGGTPTDQTLWSLVQTLAIGGWAPAVLTGALDDLLAQPSLGSPALDALLSELAGSLKDGRLLQTAVTRERPEAAPDLAAWVEALLASPAVQGRLAAADLPPGAAKRLAAALGQPPLSGSVPSA